MDKFEKILGKDNPLLDSIKRRGFTEPSEIQNLSIPHILKGKDVIAGASTGSGKTLAFAAGIIKNVKKDFGIQALILTPTRELAEQITKELEDFSKSKGLGVAAVYGGVSMGPQIRKLIGADIVVATPGRVLDHIQRGTIILNHVNTLVLDEADRMLDMGFIDDVARIIGECPQKRQTLLFSATIFGEVVDIAKKYMNNPKEVEAEAHVDPTKLKQIYYDTPDVMKFSLLKHLLEKEKSKLVMVFCNTRKNVDFVSKNLKFMGIETLAIHGGYSQDKRQKMLDTFHSNKVSVLVATDVAARGLDIKGVSHVYNYDLPLSKSEYIHRIGRTARAGKNGEVVNLLASRDYKNFDAILKGGDINVEEEKMPYVEKARIRWMPERKDDRNRRRRGLPSRDNRRGGRSPPSRGRRSTSSSPRRDSRSTTFGKGSRSPNRDSRPRRDSGPSSGARRDSRGGRRASPQRSSRGGRDDRPSRARSPGGGKSSSNSRRESRRESRPRR